jgi:uncharacterized membrane protein YqjE
MGFPWISFDIHSAIPSSKRLTNMCIFKLRVLFDVTLDMLLVSVIVYHVSDPQNRLSASHISHIIWFNLHYVLSLGRFFRLNKILKTRLINT